MRVRDIKFPRKSERKETREKSVKQTTADFLAFLLATAPAISKDYVFRIQFDDSFSCRFCFAFGLRKHRGWLSRILRNDIDRMIVLKI